MNYSENEKELDLLQSRFIWLLCFVIIFLPRTSGMSNILISILAGVSIIILIAKTINITKQLTETTWKRKQ